MSELESFHFLRPLWLLWLPVLAWTWWRVRTSLAPAEDRGGAIAPHLRDALIVNRAASSFIRPIDGVVLAMLFCTLAAAGPTWSRQQAPWFAETAPLVIALEVSDSMRANDVLPTRLDRARFEVLDLIEQRTGARTALVAYAGGAHVVMPPTEDVDVIKPFLESLDPAIMPEQGSSARSVLPLVLDLLGDDAAGGTLLFVCDGFEEADLEPLAEFAVDPAAPAVLALVLGTEIGGLALNPDGSVVTDSAGRALDTALDAALLDRVAGEAGVDMVAASAGKADLGRLLALIESNLLQADSADALWIDQGWWLLWPAALLMLFWFRAGWTMPW